MWYVVDSCITRGDNHYTEFENVVANALWIKLFSKLNIGTAAKRRPVRSVLGFRNFQNIFCMKVQ